MLISPSATFLNKMGVGVNCLFAYSSDDNSIEDVQLIIRETVGNSIKIGPHTIHVINLALDSNSFCQSQFGRKFSGIDLKPNRLH